MVKSIYKFISPKFQTLFLEYKVAFKPRFGYGPGKSNAELYKIVNSNREKYKSLLTSFLQYKEVFHAIKTSDKEMQENAPSWNNGFLPGLDRCIVCINSAV